MEKNKYWHAVTADSCLRPHNGFMLVRSGASWGGVCVCHVVPRILVPPHGHDGMIANCQQINSSNAIQCVYAYNCIMLKKYGADIILQWQAVENHYYESFLLKLNIELFCQYSCMNNCCKCQYSPNIIWNIFIGCQIHG